MKIVTLARKPLGGSVAQGVVEHRAGAINIGGTRISAHGRPLRTFDPKPGVERSVGWEPGWAGGSKASGQTSLGRWPANVLLQHTAGCKCRGTKRIRPGNGSGRTGKGAHGFQTAYVGGDKKSDGWVGDHVDDNGMETVDAWECSEGCPMLDLDGQSGVTLSSGGRTANISKGQRIYGGGRGLGQDLTPDEVRGDPGYGDVGGASRFFKQIQR